MAYDFKPFEKRIAEVIEHLSRELSGIRTGRAAPAVLDIVKVESYGASMAIRELATVSVEDPRTLRIVPWNAGDAKEIEKGITLANLGLSVSIDERGLRVSFPELTSERRQALLKVAKEKLEEARKSLRSARDEVWSDIQKKEKEGTVTEDEKFRFKDEMQKRVDDGGKKLDEMMERKEKEIAG
jgi:ribosome recycling factor